MTVHLQSVRFVVRTKDEPDAGTDSPVDMRYWVTPGSSTSLSAGWQTAVLDHSWDDRERARTEMYQIDIPEAAFAISLSGTTVPTGIRYASFVEARTAQFVIRTGGDDLWKIDCYHLLGHFIEMAFVPGTIDEFRVQDLGWRLMASAENDIVMSTDSREGLTSHPIAMNGTF